MGAVTLASDRIRSRSSWTGLAQLRTVRPIERAISCGGVSTRTASSPSGNAVAVADTPQRRCLARQPAQSIIASGAHPSKTVLMKRPNTGSLYPAR